MKGKKTLQTQIFLWLISKTARTLTLVSLLQIAVSCAHWALGCYQRDQLCKSSAKQHSQYSQCGLRQGAHQSFDGSDLSLRMEDFKFPFAFHCPLLSLSITQGAQAASNTSVVRRCQWKGRGVGDKCIALLPTKPIVASEWPLLGGGRGKLEVSKSPMMMLLSV